MGAKTPVYVKVLVTTEEWREYYALGLDDAKAEAARDVGVIRALEAQYDRPNEYWSAEC